MKVAEARAEVGRSLASVVTATFVTDQSQKCPGQEQAQQLAVLAAPFGNHRLRTQQAKQTHGLAASPQPSCVCMATHTPFPRRHHRHSPVVHAYIGGGGGPTQAPLRAFPPCSYSARIMAYACGWVGAWPDRCPPNMQFLRCQTQLMPRGRNTHGNHGGAPCLQRKTQAGPKVHVTMMKLIPNMQKFQLPIGPPSSPTAAALMHRLLPPCQHSQQQNHSCGTQP